MPTRRTLLAAFGGALVGSIGTYTGLDAADTGYGSIQWANERDEAVRVRTVVSTDGGLLAGCYHQRLLVRVTPDLSVEFLQWGC